MTSDQKEIVDAAVQHLKEEFELVLDLSQSDATPKFITDAIYYTKWQAYLEVAVVLWEQNWTFSPEAASVARAWFPP